jgi:glycosyltransferase involved in cell wall biosynthesis
VRGPQIAPDRDYEQRVRDAAASLGDTVLLTGPVEEARRLMAWFDVLCVPSLQEPFGTVAAEALAAGTPAVVTDSGGMPEYVRTGHSGEVVPAGMPDQLADALERVLARASEMADTARADAARFAPAQAARETAALLRETSER